jgi:hypothetical protein
MAQHHLLEADLDADEKVRVKLEAAVATCALTRDNFAKAITVQQAKIAEVEAKVMAERAAIERNAAADKLARDLDAVEQALPVYLNATRELANALDVIHHHFHAQEMATFIRNGQAQIDVAGAFLAQELRTTVAAIRDGSMPIPPPKPLAAPVAVAEPAPETRRLFALRPIKWTDAEGHVLYCQQFEDADLTPAAAQRALRVGAVCGLDDPRRKELRGARGGHHVNVNAIDLLDLDAVEDWSGAPHASFDPVAQANITPYDRGVPERKIAIEVART